MKADDLIHSDPAILCGKPVVRGTRLSVEFLLQLVALGWTDRQILDSYQISQFLVQMPGKTSRGDAERLMLSSGFLCVQ